MRMKKYVVDRRFFTFFKPRGRTKVAQLLAYAGVDTNPEIWLGSRIIIVLLAGLMGAMLPLSLFRLFDLSAYPILAPATLAGKLVLSFASGLFFSLLAAVLVYMHIYYLVAERTARVDAVLPDFLLMVAANLRSGMTPFSAFQASARPEFGPLQTEILYVSSLSLGSESFADALRQLTATIDSAVLRRTLLFFENGLRSGGKLAYLLETSADEIRETEEMRQQMIVNTKTYAVFVAFILVFGLPLLLAISSQFLGVFTRIQANLGGASSSPIAGLAMPKISLNPQFIDQMSLVVIVGTAMLTAVLVGVISEGKMLFGLKYFPPLAIAALFIFWICSTVLGGFIGALG